MESHSRLVKRTHRSLWLCNELVWEFCSAFPIVNTWERILLTSTNIHTYLGHRFRKMRLIYSDLITFLKAKLKANKNVYIRIDRVAQNKESEPIVVINQEEDEFVLETNNLRVRIKDFIWHRNEIFISGNDGQLECGHMLYFLRLIAPLVQPILLEFLWSYEPIEEHLMRFLSGYIDSIGLSPEQFNSTAFNETLGKFNKLKIFGLLSSVEVPKLVHWLTNGQSKKYLLLFDTINGVPPVQLLDEIKTDFVRATSQCRFVVRLDLRQSLDEFTTLCNETTGEKLELRHFGVKYGYNFYALCRFPNNEMQNIGGNCAEFKPDRMTTILL